MEIFDQKILGYFSRKIKSGLSYSEVVRLVFRKYGEIPPPIMAQYFKVLYDIQASDVIPALMSWWPDSKYDVPDKEFDRLIGKAIGESRNEPEMYELKKEIIADFSRLIREKKLGHSQMVRWLFKKHDEISPPIMAHYFEEIYAHRAMKFMPALGAWWHDNTSDISDMEFDRIIDDVLKEEKGGG